MGVSGVEKKHGGRAHKNIICTLHLDDLETLNDPYLKILSESMGYYIHRWIGI